MMEPSSEAASDAGGSVSGGGGFAPSGSKLAWENLLRAETQEGEEDECGCCGVMASFSDPVNSSTKYRWAGRGKDFYCRTIHFLKFFWMTWEEFCDRMQHDKAFRKLILELKQALINEIIKGNITIEVLPRPEEAVILLKIAIKTHKPSEKLVFYTPEGWALENPGKSLKEAIKDKEMQEYESPSGETLKGYYFLEGTPGKFEISTKYVEYKVHRTIMDKGGIKFQRGQQHDTWDALNEHLHEEMKELMAGTKRLVDILGTLGTVEGAVDTITQQTPRLTRKSAGGDSDDEYGGGRRSAKKEADEDKEPAIKKQKVGASASASALLAELEEQREKVVACFVSIGSCADKADDYIAEVQKVAAALKLLVPKLRRESLVDRVADANRLFGQMNDIKKFATSVSTYNIAEPVKRHATKFCDAFDVCKAHAAVYEHIPCELRLARVGAKVTRLSIGGQWSQVFNCITKEALMEAHCITDDGDDTEVVQSFISYSEMVLTTIFDKVEAKRKKDAALEDKFLGCATLMTTCISPGAAISVPQTLSLALPDLCALSSLQSDHDNLTTVVARVHSSMTDPIYRLFWSYDALARGLHDRANTIAVGRQDLEEARGSIQVATDFANGFINEPPTNIATFMKENLQVLQNNVKHVVDSADNPNVGADLVRAGQTTMKTCLELLFEKVLQNYGAQIGKVLQRWTGQASNLFSKQPLQRLLDDCSRMDLEGLFEHNVFKQFVVQMQTAQQAIAIPKETLTFVGQVQAFFHGVQNVAVVLDCQNFPMIKERLSNAILEKIRASGYPESSKLVCDVCEGYMNMTRSASEEFRADFLSKCNIEAQAWNAVVDLCRENVFAALRDLKGPVESAVVSLLVSGSVVGQQVFGAAEAATRFLPNDVGACPELAALAGHQNNISAEALVRALKQAFAPTEVPKWDAEVKMSALQVTVAMAMHSFFSNVPAGEYTLEQPLKFTGLLSRLSYLVNTLDGIVPICRLLKNLPASASVNDENYTQKANAAYDYVKDRVVCDILQKTMDTLSEVTTRSTEQVPTTLEQVVIAKDKAEAKRSILKQEKAESLEHVSEVVSSNRLKLASAMETLQGLDRALVSSSHMGVFGRAQNGLTKLKIFNTVVSGLMNIIVHFPGNNLKSRVGFIREWERKTKADSVNQQRIIIAMKSWQDKEKGD